MGPPKTHDLVIATLSLKNMAVGSLRTKSACHAGYRGTNLNLYKLAPYVAPHLAVIDGYQGMEGNGPVSGDRVEWRALYPTPSSPAPTLSLPTPWPRS